MRLLAQAAVVLLCVIAVQAQRCELWSGPDYF